MIRQRCRAIALALFGLFGLFAGLVAVAHVAGLRVNLTDSVPRGLYKVVKSAAKRGDFVEFCAPDEAVFRLAVERGYLHEDALLGRTPLLKRLVAMEGDLVTINVRGVSVNGKTLLNSKPNEIDGQGRPMPRIERTDYCLQAGEILLMSEYSPFSFDARYFGVQQVNCVRGVARLW